MCRDFFIARAQHHQLEGAALEFRHSGFLARACRLDNQAVLAAGHRQINFRQQLRIQQRAMQRARRIVDLVTLAQRIEAVALARMQIFGHAQRVDDCGTISGEFLFAHQRQFGIEKADIEWCVVNDQFGAGDVFQ